MVCFTINPEINYLSLINKSNFLRRKATIFFPVFYFRWGKTIPNFRWGKLFLCAFLHFLNSTIINSGRRELGVSYWKVEMESSKVTVKLKCIIRILNFLCPNLDWFITTQISTWWNIEIYFKFSHLYKIFYSKVFFCRFLTTKISS